MLKSLFIIVVFLYGLQRASAQYFDTVSIYYPVGIAEIDKAGRNTLDSILKLAVDRSVLIYSYADYLGSEQPNGQLSQSRAEGVKQYLLTKGLPVKNILQCAGLGQVAARGSRNPEGDYRSRRSDIFIKRKQPITPLKADTPVAKEQPAREKKVIAAMLDMEVGEALRLNNIGFYPGMATILPSAYPELENLYNTLYDNPGLKVRLEGHVCCCVYPDGYFEDTPTWGLSVERAIAIYKHLVQRGIAASRLQYQGFGRTKPIREHERNSEEGQVNRRVEVRILSK